MKDSPWTLAQTCSYWRAVAVSTPSLWSFVKVDASFGLSPLPMVQTQVQRSGALTIHFWACADMDSTSQVELFRLLSDHFERWEELNLCLSRDLVPLMAALRGRLPALQRLLLRWNGPESQTRVDSVQWFDTADSLVDVTAYSEYRYIPVSLPSQHCITRYDIDASGETHAQLLTLLPNLIEARIKIAFSGTWPTVDDKITLLHLQRLYVNFTDSLSELRAPRLEELAFFNTGLHPDRDKLGRGLCAFLNRSACSLKRLCLGGPLDADWTTRILRQFKTITELVFLKTSDLKEHLTMLMAGADKTVAPQLLAIHLGFQEVTSDSYRSLYMKTLESRWNAQDCHALRNATVLLDEEDWMYDPDLEALSDELRKGGLQLSELHGLAAEMHYVGWVYKRHWKC
ncbi:hypothetical protein FB45DRAFT_1001863 [Roridomyces roridus]|uniref:F-box domain-containing protein n=1 Tax=Roridomyces roridus TaxID=1738132 RepID=A0AAD7C272_9AGAR|nr:hypothetical protein FB45DRAFT_1001863 [Roridomyces roridus]